MLTLSDQTDETGRLLLEDSAPKPAVRKAERAGIPMNTVSCPYQDTPSRFGGQMNASAYEALRRDTADILNGFAWLSQHHAAADPSAASAPQRLFGVSYLGVTLAHVLFHRAQDPVTPHASLPSYIASIFKASRGIFSFSVDLLNDLGPEAAMTAAEVVRYAEDHHHLVRPQTGRVCAAPTRLIERTLGVILTGDADAARSRLGDIVEFPVLWELTQLQDEVGRALSTYRVVLENLTASGHAEDPNRLFATVVPDGPAKGQPFGRFTEQTLQLANRAQAAMNGLLGRAQNATPVGFEDLVRML
jgi:hypothetical protein